MIRYLVSRYLVGLLGVVGTCVLFGICFRYFSALGRAGDSLAWRDIFSWNSLRSDASSGFRWGAFGAGCMTYFDFRRQNLWIFYDNLRLPKYLLLGGLTFVFYLVGASLS
jgi:hypothetical protein